MSPPHTQLANVVENVVVTNNEYAQRFRTNSFTHVADRLYGVPRRVTSKLLGLAECASGNCHASIEVSLCSSAKKSLAIAGSTVVRVALAQTARTNGVGVGVVASTLAQMRMRCECSERLRGCGVAVCAFELMSWVEGGVGSCVSFVRHQYC